MSKNAEPKKSSKPGPKPETLFLYPMKPADVIRTIARANGEKKSAKRS